MKHVGRGAAPSGAPHPIDQPLSDDQLPKTPAELKAAYRYQFTSELYDESYPAGWFPVFARVCRDIDAMGAERLGFRWAQLKEKFGAARWYGSYAGPHARTESGEPSADLLNIASAIREAADQTGFMCMVCGERAELDQSRGWVLTLCEKHKEERAQRGGAYPECDLPPGPTFDEELAAAVEKSGRAIRFVTPQELLDAMGDIRAEAASLNRALDGPAISFISNPQMTSSDLMHEYRAAILEFRPFGDLSIDAAETAARLFHEFNIDPGAVAATHANESRVPVDGMTERDLLTEALLVCDDAPRFVSTQEMLTHLGAARPFDLDLLQLALMEPIRFFLANRSAGLPEIGRQYAQSFSRIRPVREPGNAAGEYACRLFLSKNAAPDNL